MESVIRQVNKSVYKYLYIQLALYPSNGIVIGMEISIHKRTFGQISIDYWKFFE